MYSEGVLFETPCPTAFVLWPEGEEKISRTSMLSVREGWNELLERVPWQWTAHLTFREEVSPKTARRKLKQFICLINHHLSGPRWYRKTLGIPWAAGVEMQTRGIVHFHVLLCGVQRLQPRAFKNWWDVRNGIARIEIVKNRAGAVRYLTKRVGKGGQVEFGGDPKLWN